MLVRWVAWWFVCSLYLLFGDLLVCLLGCLAAQLDICESQPNSISYVYACLFVCVFVFVLVVNVCMGLCVFVSFVCCLFVRSFVGL